jgi:GWxTD domain-containing protein
MKRIAAVVVISLCAAASFAAGVSRAYKDWPNTPLGYFMTNDERKQWNALQSDADAEQFIKDFVAKRGGEKFTNELATNVAQADKYLTVGKTPGSQTARGKMMILLGPVAPAGVGKKKKAGEMRMGAGMPEGGFEGPTMGDMQAAANTPGNMDSYLAVYTYTYPASALPAAYGKPLTVKFDLDPDRDRDQLEGAGMQRELDKLYELAAQAKLAAAKPATP